MYLIIWSLFIRVTYNRLYEKHSLPNHNFSEWYTQNYFVVASQWFYSLISPYIPSLTPPPRQVHNLPTKFAQPFPILFSESHTCIFLHQIWADTFIFSRFIFFPPFFRMDIRTPPLILHTPTQYVWSFTILNFNISFVLSLLLTSVTHPSPIYIS